MSTLLPGFGKNVLDLSFVVDSNGDSMPASNYLRRVDTRQNQAISWKAAESYLENLIFCVRYEQIV